MIRFFWTITMALALTAGIAAFALYDAEELVPWSNHLGASVGEVLLDDGLRAEAAGLTDVAEQLYRQSLDARFEGVQNRKMALYTLGEIVSRKPGETDRAIAYLEEAVEGEILADRSPKALYQAYDALIGRYTLRDGWGSPSVRDATKRKNSGRADSGVTPPSWNTVEERLGQRLKKD